MIQHQGSNFVRQMPRQQQLEGGGDKKVEEKKTTYDPALVGRFNESTDAAFNIANTPFQPYTNQRVAGFDPLQQVGRAEILKWATDTGASSNLDKAANWASSFQNFSTPTITAPSPITARTITAPTFTAPTVNTPDKLTARTITPQMLRDTDLSAYQNPFENDVIAGTLKDLERARQVQRVADNQSATAAKAFGGARQGVADSQTNSRYLDAVDKSSRELRMAGYDKAVAAALGDIDRRYNADTYNANAGMAADQFNINTALDADKTNATFRYNTDNTNAGRLMDASQFNANSGFQTDQFNTNTALDVAKTNATNSYNSAGLGLRAAGLLGDIAREQDTMGKNKALAIESLGDQGRKLEQARLDAAWEEFQRMLGYPAQQQDIRNKALGIYPKGETTTGTAANNPGLGTQLIGYGSLGAGLAKTGDDLGWFDWLSGTPGGATANGFGFNAYSDPFFGT